MFLVKISLIKPSLGSRKQEREERRKAKIEKRKKAQGRKSKKVRFGFEVLLSLEGVGCTGAASPLTGGA
jgi:hypothetical protein